MCVQHLFMSAEYFSLIGNFLIRDCPIIVQIAQIYALLQLTGRKPSSKIYMAFKTTHNKDESLPQFMKSPQLIFSHKNS